jgi:hypothetical protein
MADRDPNSDTSLQQILDLGPEFVINVQRAEGNPKECTSLIYKTYGLKS